jgi:streptogramin lyase
MIWYTERSCNQNCSHDDRRGYPAAIHVAESQQRTGRDHHRPYLALWFTEEWVSKMGRLTTTGALTEYPVPSAPCEPGSIANGPDGALR